MESPSLNNRWIATITSIWIQCICGPSYTFGIYSATLKSSQNYDQSTLDTVSVFKDIGATAGTLAGFLYSAVVSTSHPRRPWIVLAVGAIQCFLGYIFIWATVAGIIPRPPVPAMCLFMFLAVHGQLFLNTANVVTGVHNFQLHGGTILGILKGFLGLSGAVLIQFSNTLCNRDPLRFLLMVAILPAITTILLMRFVVIDKTETGNESVHLKSFSSIALIISGYLTILIVLDNCFILPTWARIFSLVLLVALIASPVGIAIRARTEDSVLRTMIRNGDDSFEYREIRGDERKWDLDVIDSAREIGLIEATGTVDFWVLFVSIMCSMGSGLATINNMNQLGQSLGYGSVEINTLVSLWSIWSFLGRLGAGYISDILLRKLGWARPLLMALTLATMSLGHIIIASGFKWNLYIGSIIVGICYGAQVSLMPAITAEIFGIKHMGTIYNTINVACPIGSYILSVKVIGFIYDKQASSLDNSCSGKHCFMSSFLILAAADLLGFVVAVVLFFRTRRFYRLLVQRRFKDSNIF